MNRLYNVKNSIYFLTVHFFIWMPDFINHVVYYSLGNKFKLLLKPNIAKVNFNKYILRIKSNTKKKVNFFFSEIGICQQYSIDESFLVSI